MAEKFEKIGMFTSVSVKKHTGKNWDQWIAQLEKDGARLWTHKEIVAHLKKKYKLDGWWQQGITGGFEVAIGRRLEGQNAKGEYQVTVTKTLYHPAKYVWKFLASSEGLSIWLKPLSEFELKPKHQYEAEGDVFGEVRTMKAGLRARMTWQESDWEKHTIVQLHLASRPNKSSILVFTHEKLPNIRLREQLRTLWTERLNEVKSYLDQTFPPKIKPVSSRRPK